MRPGAASRRDTAPAVPPRARVAAGRGQPPRSGTEATARRRGRSRCRVPHDETVAEDGIRYGQAPRRRPDVPAQPAPRSDARRPSRLNMNCRVSTLPRRLRPSLRGRWIHAQDRLQQRRHRRRPDARRGRAGCHHDSRAGATVVSSRRRPGQRAVGGSAVQLPGPLSGFEPPPRPVSGAR